MTLGETSKFVRTYRSKKHDALYAVVRAGDSYAVVLYKAGDQGAPETLRRFERAADDGGHAAKVAADDYARASADGERPEAPLCAYCSLDEVDEKHDPYCSAQCGINAENDSREPASGRR